MKLACDKALNLLKWKSTLSFEETVQITTDWYLQYYRQKTDMTDYTTSQIRTYQKLAAERELKWATC